MRVRLFQHTPTARWLPIVQSAKEVTPGAAYVPDLAQRYALPASEIAVLVREDLPADFESNQVPRPTRPPEPLPLERDRVFRATVLTLLDLLNVERAQHGRPEITPAQFVAAVRARL